VKLFSAWLKTFHPKLDHEGNRVKIENPTTKSSEDTWHDPSKTATFTPNSITPNDINGTRIKAASAPDHESITEIDEPKLTANKKVSTGIIMIEPDNRVWIHEPTNHFGGYEHAFPKGKLEPGLSMQQNAVKETHEETGLHAQITGHLGDYDGDTSTTRYYIGKRIGGNPADMGWESQSVKLVPMNDLHKYLNRSRDKQIATDLINKFKK